jgi:outer membrane protein
MKNLSLALNVVLLIAVGVLYYLHFSGSKAGNTSGSVGAAPSKMAFINADSVLKYYEYTKVNSNILEAKGKRLQKDMENRALGLRNEIENYQRTRNSLTIGQAQAIEEDLGRKQQNFQMYQQSVQQEVMNDQEKLSRDLYTRVTKFLKKYGNDNGLQVVLKFDTSSDLLFAGDSLDISKQVIEGLNADYKAETAVKPDSTTKK